MTDGIIQKFFKKEKDNWDINSTDYYELNRMEQELIEKIKQNVNKRFRCSYVDTDEIIQMLIGDNQE